MSGGEIFVIIFVAILLFGTKRIPEIARTLGRGVQEFKKAADEIKREIAETDIAKDISGIKNTINENDITKGIGKIRQNIEETGISKEIGEIKKGITESGLSKEIDDMTNNLNG